MSDLINAMKLKVNEMADLIEEKAHKNAVINAFKTIEIINKVDWEDKIPFPHISTGSTGNLLFQWDGKETEGRELYIIFLIDKNINILSANKEVEISKKLKLGIDEIPEFDKIISNIKWLVHGGILN